MKVNLKQINFLTFNGSYFLGYTYVPNYGIYIPQPTHKDGLSAGPSKNLAILHCTVLKNAEGLIERGDNLPLVGIVTSKSNGHVTVLTFKR